MANDKHSERIRKIVEETYKEYYDTIKDMTELELAQFDNHVQSFRLNCLKKELLILKKYKDEKEKSLQKGKEVTQVCN